MLIVKIEMIEMVILKIVRISVLKDTHSNIHFFNLKLKHYLRGEGNTR